jgi:hypothetical protein
LGEEKKRRLECAIAEIVKDIDFLDEEILSVVVNLWSEILGKDEFVFRKEEFLSLVKRRKFIF